MQGDPLGVVLTWAYNIGTAPCVSSVFYPTPNSVNKIILNTTCYDYGTIMKLKVLELLMISGKSIKELSLGISAQSMTFEVLFTIGPITGSTNLMSQQLNVPSMHLSNHVIQYLILQQILQALFQLLPHPQEAKLQKACALVYWTLDLLILK